jgi:hypothetical protein
MEYEDFRKNLRELNISMKEFSTLIKTSYGTVRKWGKDGRAVPSWVETWIDLYREKKELEKYRESIQTLMGGIKAS